MRTQIADSGLHVYLSHIKANPLLTAEMERKLAWKIALPKLLERRIKRRAPSPEELRQLQDAHDQAQAARQQMILGNLRLVVSIAKRFANRGLPIGDLIEEGNLGLMRAVEGFDPSMDYRFSTYAVWWIRQAIRLALLEHGRPVRIPTGMVIQISKLLHVSEELRAQSGQEPTHAELSQRLGVDENRIVLLQQVQAAVKNGGRVVSDVEDAGAGLLADPRTPSPEAALFCESERERIRKVLDRLSPRAAAIVRSHYGIDQDPQTFRQIADKIGLSQERVRQILHSSLQKLHEFLRK